MMFPDQLHLEQARDRLYQAEKDLLDAQIGVGDTQVMLESITSTIMALWVYMQMYTSVLTHKDSEISKEEEYQFSYFAHQYIMFVHLFNSWIQE